MGQVTFDYSKAMGYVSQHEIDSMKAITESARQLLLSKSGAGNDYLGWINLPVDYDKDEFARIKAASDKIRSDSEVLVVIGIGGSYLGARAAIEFLGHNFFNSVSKDVRKAPEIYFVGNSISSTYLYLSSSFHSCSGFHCTLMAVSPRNIAAGRARPAPLPAAAPAGSAAPASNSPGR